MSESKTADTKSKVAAPSINTGVAQPPQAAAKPKTRFLQKLHVREVRDHNPQIRELILECEDPVEFNFKAGQFVMLHVPAEPKALLRAYSIASDDRTKNGYRLIFKYVDGGAASEFVWKLKGGDTLDFTGPFGRVVFKEPPTEQIVFFNTGSGVSQHFSFLESNIEKYPELRYRLFFGVRTKADIYYVDELERLKAQAKNFEYHFVLSRAESDWAGKRGYIQHFLHELEHDKIPTTFYLCGNGAMIKDVKAALNESGFSAANIHSEAFD